MLDTRSSDMKRIFEATAALQMDAENTMDRRHKEKGNKKEA